MIRVWGNIFGTGISHKEKLRKKKFQMCLYLSFYNYKIVFKVGISSPLQTQFKLFDSSNRKETRPRRQRI